MDVTPATFGGPGWHGRGARLADDIAAGHGWAAMRSDSEYGVLRDVLLYRPRGTFPALDPDEMLFLDSVSTADLACGFESFVAAYAGCGITVHDFRDGLVDDTRHPNTVFLRDTYWMTPCGAVVGRMASDVRAGEERYVSAALADLGIPIALTIGGSGTAEGADFLWLRPDHVLCGVGRRTNEDGCAQVAEFLRQQGVRVTPVRVADGVQHLLGGVQIISASRALVRTAIVSPGVREALLGSGYQVIDVPEHPDVRYQMVFNLVTIAPDTVVVHSSPWFTRFLECMRVTVAGTVDGSYHARAGGGLACSTGILNRQPA